LEGQLAGLVAAVGDGEVIGRAVTLVLSDRDAGVPEYDLAGRVVEAMRRRGMDWRTLDSKAAARLGDVVDHARGTVRSTDAPSGAKVAAIRLMARVGLGAEDVEAVAALLDARVDPAVQGAAAAALSATRSEAAARKLVAGLGSGSPVVRAEIVNALVGRKEWAAMLLDALEKGEVHAREVPAEQRQRLLASADAAVRARAEKVFARATSSSRAAVVERVGKQVIALKGEAERGAKVFEKTCAACHQLGGIGHAVGPDLAAVTDKSVAGLLAAILDPNAAINGQFVAYTVETTDDRSLTGIIAEENAGGIVVAMGNGIRESVKRAEIRSVSTARMSLMPEGLEEVCSPQELADVIAFVGAGGPAAK
jgi:putative heme-binding domain-containing protein